MPDLGGRLGVGWSHSYSSATRPGHAFGAHITRCVATCRLHMCSCAVPMTHACVPCLRCVVCVRACRRKNGVYPTCFCVVTASS